MATNKFGFKQYILNWWNNFPGWTSQTISLTERKFGLVQDYISCGLKISWFWNIFYKAERKSGIFPLAQMFLVDKRIKISWFWSIFSAERKSDLAEKKEIILCNMFKMYLSWFKVNLVPNYICPVLLISNKKFKFGLVLNNISLDRKKTWFGLVWM